MKRNAEKTKVMLVAEEQTDINIKIEGKQIDQVQQYKYLGANIERRRNQEVELNQKIMNTIKVKQALYKIFLQEYFKGNLRRSKAKCVQNIMPSNLDLRMRIMGVDKDSEKQITSSRNEIPKRCDGNNQERPNKK